MPAVVPPIPPTPPVPDVAELIAESGVATHILSAERVVKGAPYCAQAVHETVQALADGNRIVRQQTSQLCRDGEGRTRQEVERQGRKMVYLRDAVSGENWLLDPERKTARYLGGGRASAEAQREYGERMREYQDKMRDYNEKTRPVLELFQRKEFVHDIDARPPVEEVQQKIRAALSLPAYGASQTS